VTAAVLAAAPADGALVVRVLVAAGIGMVVGWEREIRNRAAGSRTFGLMTVGAALFTIAGVLVPDEPGRVIAGIATGVGFIGAGVVWRGHAHDVHGLTTAAGMWAMVGAGVLAGLGRPLLAAAVAGLIIFLFEFPYIPLIRSIDPRQIQHKFMRDTDFDEPDTDVDESPTPRE
jgi:putative Mg2+ transporter-C (MgtC) family protein